METTSILKPCQDCSIPLEYEPIHFDGIDLTASLPHVCPACQVIRQQAYRKQEKEKRIAEAQQHCRNELPPEMLKTSMDHVDYNKKLHEALRRQYDASPSQNIVVQGHAGRCKSRCFARLMLVAAARGYKGRWLDTRRLTKLSIDYQNWRTKSFAFSEIETFGHAAILVLDDFGKAETYKGGDEEVLFLILDHRYGQGLPTWTSANTAPSTVLAEGKFSKDRGPAIVDRIYNNALFLENV